MYGHNRLFQIASFVTSFIRRWEGALWLAGATGIVLMGGILVWRFCPKIGNDAESFSTTLPNVALVIGGVAAILLAVWRSRDGGRQAAIAQRQAEIAQHGLMNERYQRGTEVLGSEILSARLGGIYALKQLAGDYSQQYHFRVMRLFCGFVRLPTATATLSL